ncbi:hypothetical protein D3C72_2172920 [compost metagenome]
MIFGEAEARIERQQRHQGSAAAGGNQAIHQIHRQLAGSQRPNEVFKARHRRKRCWYDLIEFRIGLQRRDYQPIERKEQEQAYNDGGKEEDDFCPFCR